MSLQSAISSPTRTSSAPNALPASTPEGNRSPLLSSADSNTFNNPSTGAIALPSDDKDKKDHDDATVRAFGNPFADPLPPKTEIDNASLTVAHSHHLANVHLTGSTTGSATHRLAAPPYDPAIEEVHIASERLAQALEEAADRQTDARKKRALQRRARKVRQKMSSASLADLEAGSGFLSEDDVKGKRVLKMTGGGFLLLFTTPVYLAGAIIEGTGLMLKATGMVFKGAGKGLKKLHTLTVEKLDLNL